MRTPRITRPHNPCLGTGVGRQLLSRFRRSESRECRDQRRRRGESAFPERDLEYTRWRVILIVRFEGVLDLLPGNCVDSACARLSDRPQEIDRHIRVVVIPRIAQRSSLVGADLTRSQHPDLQEIVGQFGIPTFLVPPVQVSLRAEHSQDAFALAFEVAFEDLGSLLLVRDRCTILHADRSNEISLRCRVPR